MEAHGAPVTVVIAFSIERVGLGGKVWRCLDDMTES
jgi:hypothetical protein